MNHPAYLINNFGFTQMCTYVYACAWEKFHVYHMSPSPSPLPLFQKYMCVCCTLVSPLSAYHRASVALVVCKSSDYKFSSFISFINFELHTIFHSLKQLRFCLLPWRFYYIQSYWRRRKKIRSLRFENISMVWLVVLRKCHTQYNRREIRWVLFARKSPSKRIKTDSTREWRGNANAKNAIGNLEQENWNGPAFFGADSQCVGYLSVTGKLFYSVEAGESGRGRDRKR